MAYLFDYYRVRERARGNTHETVEHATHVIVMVRHTVGHVTHGIVMAHHNDFSNETLFQLSYSGSRQTCYHNRA